MYLILVLLLLCIVIVRVIIEINNEDEDLREVFIKEYINSDDCAMVKINSLPNSFKIGNVYFDKYDYNSMYYQTLLSYVAIDGKVYDNGTLTIDKEWDFSYNTNNRDLMNYILDNLDKAEEVKQ